MSALMGAIEAEARQRLLAARERLGMVPPRKHFPDVRIATLEERVASLSATTQAQAAQITELTATVTDLRCINDKLERDLVRELMKGQRVLPAPKVADRPTGFIATQDRWQLILEEVAFKYNVSSIDIRSARRDKQTCIARNEVFYRLRHETTLSVPRIGHLVGQRDHSTVLNGIHRHEKRLAENHLGETPGVLHSPGTVLPFSPAAAVQNADADLHEASP